MNLSLDGYVEALGQDDGSWLRIDDEVHAAFNERAAGAAAFLYGRKVFEVMIPYWPDAAGDPSRPKYEYEYAQIWLHKPKVVFSSALQQSNWNTRVVPGGVIEEVEKLKAEATSDLLCYGGPQLISALDERRLIDEYVLYVHPTALGAGKPFFRCRTPLQLLGTRRFAIGTVELRYAGVSSAAKP